jgi:ribonuclease HII
MLELELIQTFPHLIIATDEVGRGPLCGPVVIGSIAVKVQTREELKTLLETLKQIGINDSKKLSDIKRQNILKNLNIQESEFRIHNSIKLLKKKIDFITWDISHQEIDQENILAASLRGMKEASEFLVKTKQKQITVLIDGHQTLRGDKKFSWNEIPLIKGDSRSVLIGLASIIAKEKRDSFMRFLDEKYPEYGLAEHFGYPTKKHKKAIEEFGPTPIHRKTFKGVKEFVRH